MVESVETSHVWLAYFHIWMNSNHWSCTKDIWDSCRTQLPVIPATSRREVAITFADILNINYADRQVINYIEDGVFSKYFVVCCSHMAWFYISGYIRWYISPGKKKQLDRNVKFGKLKMFLGEKQAKTIQLHHPKKMVRRNSSKFGPPRLSILLAMAIFHDVQEAIDTTYDMQQHSPKFWGAWQYSSDFLGKLAFSNLIGGFNLAYHLKCQLGFWFQAEWRQSICEATDCCFQPLSMAEWNLFWDDHHCKIHLQKA